MKNIISAYTGNDGYHAIMQSIQDKVEAINPDTGAAQLFKEQALNILGSNSPLLELTAFCTNDELVNRNDSTVNDVIDFMKKETARGDLNFLVNLAKEEYFANKSKQGVDYDIKGDEVINNLKLLFNEPHSVIEEALKKGMFDAMESDIIKDIKLNEFKTERESKRRNSINKDFGNQSWTELNESVSFDVNNQNLLAYNPIGLGVETEDNEIALLIKDNLLRLHQDGIIPATYEDYLNKLTPENKNLLNAINSVPYDIESETYSLGGDVWDFDLTLSSTENGNKLLQLRDNFNKDNVTVIAEEDLQEFLFESVEFVVSQNPNNPTLKQQLYSEVDNFMMLSANFGRLIKLEDYIEIVNPETGHKVLIHKIEGANSVPTIINSNIGSMMEYPTYSKMLTSIMEILKPNDFQATTLMQYFQDRLNEDVIKATEIQKERDAVQTRVNELATMITEAENIKNVAHSDSEIYKQKVAELNDLNAKYSTELVRLKELNQKVAYYG